MAKVFTRLVSAYKFLFRYIGLGMLTVGGLDGSLSAQDTLDPRTKEVFLSAINSVDSHWDSRAALIGSGSSHTVRGSSWYGLGLMTRDEPGDFERGIRTLCAVAATQIDLPEMPWDGTFKRVAEEKLPPPKGRAYVDYDPNWREFVGTVFALALIQHGDRISAHDTEILENAIKHAVSGEIRQGRLLPTYTNISLMYAFLRTFAGKRFHNERWLSEGQAWTEKVYNAYKLNESFDEFNSPTYYGVDFYGLALLRRYGVTPRLREMGATMEAGLWRDVARFYHPGLKNLAGPFDRAYGMDMTQYASLVGVWLSFSLPNNQMPLPQLGSSMDHGGDFLCAMTYAALGTHIPSEVVKDLTVFPGEHRVTQKIADGSRTATAWFADDIMIGAEETGLTRGILTPKSQFHPATIHWKLSDGGIAWMYVSSAPLLDAKADKNLLNIHSNQGDVVFRIHATGVNINHITKAVWELPNLRVNIESNAKTWQVARVANDIEIRFNDVSLITLNTHYSTSSLKTP